MFRAPVYTCAETSSTEKLSDVVVGNVWNVSGLAYLLVKRSCLGKINETSRSGSGLAFFCVFGWQCKWLFWVVFLENVILLAELLQISFKEYFILILITTGRTRIPWIHNFFLLLSQWCVEMSSSILIFTRRITHRHFCYTFVSNSHICDCF